MPLENKKRSTDATIVAGSSTQAGGDAMRQRTKEVQRQQSPVDAAKPDKSQETQGDNMGTPKNSAEIEKFSNDFRQRGEDDMSAQSARVFNDFRQIRAMMKDDSTTRGQEAQSGNHETISGGDTNTSHIERGLSLMEDQLRKVRESTEAFRVKQASEGTDAATAAGPSTQNAQVSNEGTTRKRKLSPKGSGPEGIGGIDTEGVKRVRWAKDVEEHSDNASTAAERLNIFGQDNSRNPQDGTPITDFARERSLSGAPGRNVPQSPERAAANRSQLPERKDQQDPGDDRNPLEIDYQFWSN